LKNKKTLKNVKKRDQNEKRKKTFFYIYDGSTPSFRFIADMLYNLLHDKSNAGDKSATSERAESNWPTLTTLQQVHDVSATNLQQIKVGPRPNGF